MVLDVSGDFREYSYLMLLQDSGHPEARTLLLLLRDLVHLRKLLSNCSSIILDIQKSSSSNVTPLFGKLKVKLCNSPSPSLILDTQELDFSVMLT